MASSPYPTRTYLPGQFVVSAGSILFRRAPENGELQMCLLYHTIKDEWLLPKGRKDCGESIETTAVRETYEETGKSVVHVLFFFLLLSIVLRQFEKDTNASFHHATCPQEPLHMVCIRKT